MSKTVSSSINVTVSYTQTQTQGSRSLTDTGSLVNTINFTNGSGSGQANDLYHTTGVLASGGRHVFDFAALNTSLFNYDATISFSGGSVKVLAIENLSTGVAADIRIATTGSNALTSIFNGGSGNIPIKPAGSYVYTNKYSGIPITSSQRYLYLDDTGGLGASFEILVIGVTG